MWLCSRPGQHQSTSPYWWLKGNNKRELVVREVANPHWSTWLGYGTFTPVDRVRFPDAELFIRFIIYPTQSFLSKCHAINHIILITGPSSTFGVGAPGAELYLFGSCWPYLIIIVSDLKYPWGRFYTLVCLTSLTFTPLIVF